MRSAEFRGKRVNGGNGTAGVHVADHAVQHFPVWVFSSHRNRRSRAAEKCSASASAAASRGARCVASCSQTRLVISNFSRKRNASRYFIVCAMKMDNCELGHDLLRLRRDLLWDNVPIPDYFHATKDTPYVRDRVYEVLNQHDFEIYAQILEKSKAQRQIRESQHRFYKRAWYYLFRHTMRRIIPRLDDQLMVTTASIGVKKGQADFSDAIRDVLEQTQKIDAGSWRASFCSSASDPLLQAADYCTWAIQRKWERGDERAYDRVRQKIKYEFDLWGRGDKHYY